MDKFKKTPTFTLRNFRYGNIAACGTLGVYVTSDSQANDLLVIQIPKLFVSGFLDQYTLGGEGSCAPMQFKFVDQYMSGYLAFMGPPSRRRLLVTDAGHAAVHIIDVVGKTHEGYVAPPGTLFGPRGVAARGNLVAVSTWKFMHESPHTIVVFEGSGTTWSMLRAIATGFGGPGGADGQLYTPSGLRFTGDGTKLVVADEFNNRVSMFRVEDGSFERHVVTQIVSPQDVEEWEDGWLVSSFDFNRSIQFVVNGEIHSTMGRAGRKPGQFTRPATLALVPQLGLVVSELSRERVQMFATHDAIAIASMSKARVGWMVAVARGITARRRRADVV
jgi:hypothetical protein